MFNYINSPTNHRDYISSFLPFNSSYHGYQTGTDSYLSVVRFNHTASQSSFVYQSITNQKSNSTVNFKNKLENHFCSKYLSFFFNFFWFCYFFTSNYEYINHVSIVTCISTVTSITIQRLLIQCKIILE